MAMFQIFKDKSGEWRWRLRADNNQIIATPGESYKKLSTCIRGIKLVKKLSQEAKIKEAKKE